MGSKNEWSMKKLVVNGVEYQSQAEAISILCPGITNYSQRIKKGWTTEQALELEAPPISDHKSYNFWLKKTNSGEKLCSGCKTQQPIGNFYEFKDNGKEKTTTKCKTCCCVKESENSRIRKFGLNSIEWNKLFELQNKQCRICKTKETTREWHTDHNHETGKIRGILCFNCNHLLGNCKDNVAILKNAIKYLEKHFVSNK